MIRFKVLGKISSLIIIVGGAGVSNNNIPLEMTNAKWRGIYGQMHGWPVATMILVVLAYFITNWRHLVLAGAMSGLLVLFGWL